MQQSVGGEGTFAGSKRRRAADLDADGGGVSGLVPPTIRWRWSDDAFGTWDRPARDAVFCEFVLPVSYPSDAEPALRRVVAAFAVAQSLSDGFGESALDMRQLKGELRLVHTVWVPSLLRPPNDTLQPGFPSVGFGNKLNIYIAARLAAALLGLRLAVSPMPFQLSPLPSHVDYCRPSPVRSSAASFSSEGEGLVLPAVGSPSDGAFLPAVPLAAWLALQRRIGSDYTLTRPSFFTLGSVLQSSGCLGAIGSWIAPLARRMIAASITAERALAAASGPKCDSVAEASASGPAASAPYSLRLSEPGTWAVHLRTGDVWIERGSGSRSGRDAGGGRVNASYAPPPVWWYGWLARKFSPSCVLLVSSNTASTLVSAVDAAFRDAGVTDVRRVSQTPEADFGVLVRAQTLVASVSTFAWWAAFMAAFMHSEPKGHYGEPGARRAVRIFWPQTGMAHPDSIHHAHARLHLEPQASVQWVDPALVAAASARAAERSVVASAAQGGFYRELQPAGDTTVAVASAASTPGSAPAASTAPALSALCASKSASSDQGPLAVEPRLPVVPDEPPSSPESAIAAFTASSSELLSRRSAALDVLAFDLGIMDDWASSASQQAQVLRADPPEQFLARYGAPA